MLKRNNPLWNFFIWLDCHNYYILFYLPIFFFFFFEISKEIQLKKHVRSIPT